MYQNEKWHEIYETNRLSLMDKWLFVGLSLSYSLCAMGWQTSISVHVAADKNYESSHQIFTNLCVCPCGMTFNVLVHCGQNVRCGRLRAKLDIDE